MESNTSFTKPKFGVVFPQTEIGASRERITDYTLAAERAGYSHMLAFDHVLGADAAGRPGWSSAYNVDSELYEPFVLFSFLAALSKLEFVTGVLILPQRQTALVAKQAATLAVLSGGRLRLGVGLGWNTVEYAALGRPFARRGATLEQQIGLLRDLWSQRVVSAAGVHDEIVDRAGIAPRPVGNSIPLWIGAGAARPALERVGRLADGFIPQPELGLGRALEDAVDAVHAAAAAAGRNPAELGLQGTVKLTAGGIDQVLADVARWCDLGATHIAFYTTRMGLAGGAHIEAVQEIAEALALPAGAER